MSKQVTIADTSSATLYLDDLLRQLAVDHKEQIDKLHVTGLHCCDPEEAKKKPGRHRRNFWLWVCTEYSVQNGSTLWLDLHAVEPLWVRTVLGLLKRKHPNDSELLVKVKW